MIRIQSKSYDEFTLGVLTLNNFKCFTLELPDKDNQKNISCIPAGEYKYKHRISNKNGEALELIGVPNRTYIQIHSGNYTSQIEGCILVGNYISFLNSDNIPDVANSKNTLKELINEAGSYGTIKIER